MNLGEKDKSKIKLAMKILIVFAVFAVIIAAAAAKLYPYEPRNPLSGREWPPGSPWPLPQSMSTTNAMLTFDPSNFRIVLDIPASEKCDPLDFAVSKYNNEFLFPTIAGIPRVPDPEMEVVSQLRVTVLGGPSGNTECQNYPRLADEDFNIYEHYLLRISPDGLADLEAETVWGALRGIETFSQIIFSNDNYEEGSGPLHFHVNGTTISDYPRFPHRGLMIDTSRHYQPEKIFYELLDGMMYNKLNVFHWHLTDDQSFPYISPKFPKLAQEGAYSSRHVYTQAMIARVIDAARLRGIRVILEFDTPGHTQSWGNAYPELLTPCYGIPGQPGTPNPPEHAARENLDPTKEFTYTFMRDFFTEVVQNVSKDNFVHLGMDEVYPACWESSPEIAEFMRANNLTNISQVQEYYTERHIDMIKSIGGYPIIWQDPLDFGVQVNQDVLIQVWKDWGPDWQTNLQNVLDKGYKTLLSAPWYINYINYGESWRAYYEADPVLSLQNITEAQKPLIRGGEACLWAEFVDQTNILPRLFPNIGAVAERLWTNGIPISSAATLDARKRLDQFRCKLLQRGIPAQPILNGFCGAWEVLI